MKQTPGALRRLATGVRESPPRETSAGFFSPDGRASLFAQPSRTHRRDARNSHGFVTDAQRRHKQNGDPLAWIAAPSSPGRVAYCMRLIQAPLAGIPVSALLRALRVLIGPSAYSSVRRSASAYCRSARPADGSGPARAGSAPPRSAPTSPASRHCSTT